MGISDETRLLLTREAEAIRLEWKRLKKAGGSSTEIAKLEGRYNELRAMLATPVAHASPPSNNVGTPRDVANGTPPSPAPPPPVPLSPRPHGHSLQDGHQYGVPTVNVNLPDRSNTASLVLAIFAFVLCIPAMLISWIPFFGVLGLPLAMLGGLLAGIGIVIALTKRGRGTILPVIAFVMCCIAGLITITVTSVASSGISNRMDEANRQSYGTNQQALNPSSATDDWAHADTPVTQGDVSVAITGVGVGQVNLIDEITSEAGTSENHHLGISIRIANNAANSKKEYRSWNGEDLSFTRDYAALRDNHGNVYKRVDFGYRARVAGALKTETLYPGEHVTDFLVFERPVDSFEYLEIELPATNFGGSGMLRFRVRADMVSW